MKNVTKHIYYTNRVTPKSSFIMSNHHIYKMSETLYIYIIKTLYEK